MLKHEAFGWVKRTDKRVPFHDFLTAMQSVLTYFLICSHSAVLCIYLNSKIGYMFWKISLYCCWLQSFHYFEAECTKLKWDKNYAVSYSVVGCCEVDKHNSGLLFSRKATSKSNANRVTWSTADLSCRVVCSYGSSRSMIGSTGA